MKRSLAEIERIQELLKNSPEGLSIKEIAALLEMNRNSVAKYLDILQAQGSATTRRVGTSKIFHFSRRLPEQAIRRFCTRPYLILDQNLEVKDANALFMEHFHLKKIPPSSLRLSQPPFPFLQEEFIPLARAALKGGDQHFRIQGTASGGDVPSEWHLVPITLESGKPGIAVTSTEDRGPIRSGHGEADVGDATRFLDQAAEYFVGFTPDGVIRFVNEAYLRALGRKRGDLIGHVFRSIIPGEDSQKVAASIRSLSPKNPVVTTEHRAIMENGDIRWQHWEDRAIFDSTGKVVEYWSVGKDITDQRNLERQLSENKSLLDDAIQAKTRDLREINSQLYQEIAKREKIEQQLLHTQFAMDHASDLILWVDHRGRITYANRQAVESMGLPLKGLLTKAIWELIRNCSPEGWESFWGRVRTSRTVRAEGTLLRVDDSTFPVELAADFLAYQGREYACLFIRDITAQRRTLEALMASETQYRTLAEHFPHGSVVLFTPDLRILLADGEGLRDLNVSKEILEGRTLNETFPPGLSSSLEGLFKAALAGKAGTAETIHEDRVYEIQAIPIAAAAGESTAGMALIQDITGRKREQEALNQANRKLNLISSLARHEILNKITVSLGFLNRAKKLGEDRTMNEYITRSENAVISIRKIIEFTRDWKDLGMSPPAWQHVRSVFMHAASHQKSSGIEFRLRTDDLEIYADPFLEKVFFHLIEYSLQPGRNVTWIEVSFAENPEGGNLLFRDDGPGLAPDKKTEIFEIRMTQGTGFGLFLAKEILSITGIRIGESGVGENGIQFAMQVPRGGYRGHAQPGVQAAPGVLRVHDA
ncbi:MAG: PAS domain-containing protein [Methanolinea sp.]|nr:PAS domain-containing protein [Methanolinea sp.]